MASDWPLVEQDKSGEKQLSKVPRAGSEHRGGWVGEWVGGDVLCLQWPGNSKLIG